MKVFIDPGHGGSDPGAIGYVIEKEVNLALAKALKFVLTNDGVQVVYTRSDDSFVSIRERYEMANRVGGDLFISIHCNSAENKAAQGTEVFYYSPQYKAFAGELQQKIVSVLGTNDRGAKRAKFAVIRKTKMPAVLMELAFISNQEDGDRLRDLLNDRELRLELVNQLAKVIKDYKKPVNIVKGIFKFLKKKEQ